MLMSLKDASHELGLTVDFLRRLIKRRLLPARMRRLPNHPMQYMVSPDEMWDWIEVTHPRTDKPPTKLNPTIRKIYEGLVKQREGGRKGQRRKKALALKRLESIASGSDEKKEDES